MLNGKNRLHDFVRDLGYRESCVRFKTTQKVLSENYTTRATVTFSETRKIVGIGKGLSRVKAEIAASEEALSIIAEKHQDLLVDWKQVFVEAQAGDALIKLCAYLSDAFETIEQKSLWLQNLESDNHLAEIFDTLQRKNDPLVAVFGSNLGTKKKATWIEASIWRIFGNACLSADTRAKLNELAVFLKN